MRYFMKKVYGFNAPNGPLRFSEERWLEDALGKLNDGDRVVLVGTLREPTARENRGRILGMIEPTRRRASADAFDLSRRPQHYKKNGQDRWQFALESRRAWRFLDRPHFSEICRRQFSRTDASRIVELRPDEARQIERLRYEEVEVLMPSVQGQSPLREEWARRKAAPAPTTTRKGVMHMRREPAYTYAFRIEGADRMCFKIGWAFDHETRRRQFNMASLPSIGGLRYTPHIHQRWDTARQAFQMEQALLNHFDAKRRAENHEVLFDISQKELEHVWANVVLRPRKR